MDLIRARVSEVRRRHQRQWAWLCCSWGLVAGGLAGCALGIARRVTEAELSWLVIAGAVLAGPALGFLFSLLQPRPLREAAISIDRRCGLKDRVATALSFITQPHSGATLRDLQIEDAAAHLAKIDPAQVAPIQAPRPWWWGLSFTAAAVIIAFLTTAPRQAVANVVSNDVVTAQASRVANQLEELKQFNQQNADPEVEKLLKELSLKVQEMKEPSLDPKEALAKLSEMEAALQAKQQQLAEHNTEAALKEIGQSLALAEPLQSAGEAMSHGNMEKAGEELTIPQRGFGSRNFTFIRNSKQF